MYNPVKNQTFLKCLRGRCLQVMLLLCSLSVLNVQAGQLSTEDEKKKAYLKQRVLNSGCEFSRNGKVYPIKDSWEHVERKYEYFEDKINTIDDFIRLSATRSEMTKRPYYVTCEGKKERTKDWLYRQLELYGNTQNAAQASATPVPAEYMKIVR